MTAELMLRWSGGSLDLMGWNSDPSGDYEIQALADGTEWGNPEAVRRTLRRFLLDGSTSTKEYDENRVISLALRVKAADGIALAGGEASLAQIDGRRCELVWTPPDAYSKAAVFVIDHADLRHKMDDLAETLRLERFYSLSLDALPHAYSDEWVEVESLPVETSTRNLVDACGSLTGWEGYYANLSIATAGEIQVSNFGSSSVVSVQRLGAVDMTPDRFLAVDMTSIYATNLTVYAGTGSSATWPSVPRVGADGNFALYDVGADVTGIRFEWKVSGGSPFFNFTNFATIKTVSKQATLRTTAARIQARSFLAPGSMRTPLSLSVEASSGLGDAILVSGADYDPTLSLYGVAGSNMRIVDASASLTGSYDRLSTGTPTAFYRRPASGIPAGEYVIWARMSLIEAQGISLRADLLTSAGVLQSSYELGAMTLPATGGWVTRPLMAATLPPWGLPENSSAIFQLTASRTSGSSGVDIRFDEWFLCNLNDGSVTIIKAGSNTKAWMDAASMERDHPIVLVGTGDKSSSRPASMNTELLAWTGTHIAIPGQNRQTLGTTGVGGVTLKARFRPAWHTHPAALS